MYLHIYVVEVERQINVFFPCVKEKHVRNVQEAAVCAERGDHRYQESGERLAVHISRCNLAK